MAPRKLLVIYSTYHGQSQRIAQHIANNAVALGVDTQVRDVRDTTAADLDAASAAIIVAAVHFGRHSCAVTRFVKANYPRLNAMHSAFVSVSGAAIEAASHPEAGKCAAQFLRATNWTPGEEMLAGGGIPFTKYNPLMRFMMKRISASQGKYLDTKRDYDFTDWDAVTRFARNFVANDELQLRQTG